MRLRRLRCLGALPLALIAAACSGSEQRSEAQPLPPASRAPSVSASPAPSATPTGPTAASAAAFVRAYYAAVNKSATTGKKVDLRSRVASQCRVCARLQDSIDKSADSSEHLSRPPLRTTVVRTSKPSHLRATVALRVTTTRVAVLDRAGHVKRYLPTTPSFFESVDLVWHSGSWKITNIQDFS